MIATPSWALPPSPLPALHWALLGASAPARACFQACPPPPHPDPWVSLGSGRAPPAPGTRPGNPEGGVGSRFLSPLPQAASPPSSPVLSLQALRAVPSPVCPVPALTPATCPTASPASSLKPFTSKQKALENSSLLKPFLCLSPSCGGKSPPLMWPPRPLPALTRYSVSHPSRPFRSWDPPPCCPRCSFYWENLSPSPWANACGSFRTQFCVTSSRKHSLTAIPHPHRSPRFR